MALIESLMANEIFVHLVGCLLQLQLAPSKHYSLNEDVRPQALSKHYSLNEVARVRVLSKHYSLNEDARARFIKPEAFYLTLVNLLVSIYLDSAFSNLSLLTSALG